jgi:hypothetical protein
MFPLQNQVIVMHGGVQMGGAYSSIQDAINAAASGDTILVGAGTYNETVTVNKSVTIDGANFGVSSTGARGAESVVAGLFVTASGVTVDGMKITGSANNDGTQAGVLITGTAGQFTLQHSILTRDPSLPPPQDISFGFTTVYGQESDGLTLNDNSFSAWDAGAYLQGGVTLSDATVTGNTFNGNAAQLSQVTYQAGSGTDMLWVRVNDGTGFGPWSTSFTVSDPPQLQTVQAGETLEVASSFSGSVAFAADTGTLKLDNSSSFAGTVAGMTGRDTIDFADIDPTKVQQPTFNGNSSGGTLTLTDGTHAANIALLGNYMASLFVAGSDGSRWNQ